MIEVKNVYKSFDGKSILKDITTKFEDGKVNLIIGKSGSGKTVLLKSLLGLHQVDSGSILFDGRDITQLSHRKMKAVREQIGMVFQGGALFDSQNVIDNVMFPLDIFTTMSKQEKRLRAMECLERVNLPHAEKLFPGEISGGMKKRVAIARAIVMSPKYLFCDEPNSGLDPVTSVVIDNLIQEITHDFGMTTIVNTHDMNSVLTIGEKIVFINQGTKEWEGDHSGVYRSDNKALNDFIFSNELFERLKSSF